MTAPPDPDDDVFQGWLEDRLDTELGVQAAAPAPANALYREPTRRRVPTPLRAGLAAGAAVLAIGGGAAYATGLVTGTAVSQSAQSCPSGHDDSHGDCVAAVARTSDTSETTETESTSGTRSNGDTHGDAVSNAAHTCPTSPPDAHGDCVSSIASAGHGSHTESSTVTTSTTGSANARGQSASGEHTSNLPLPH